MLVVIILLVLVLIVAMTCRKQRTEIDYKCFLLTIKNAKSRQERFMKHFNGATPLEVIYGPNTKNVKIAREYEEIVDPEYFEKALEMHYDPLVKRPNITYFNLGAIGCFVGHMDFYRRCFEQGLKYAVIFEDNVIIKSPRLFDEIQKVIDEKGENFEMCFFHCLSRLPEKREGTLEKVNWISSTKCYLVNVDNMRKYEKYFYPMDNHIDMKHEDIIAKGARVYYKDMRKYMLIDRSQGSLIGHSEHGEKDFFSRHHPEATPTDVKWGY
jgi:GR25 family glycosyltransferase involved in LPS biosynthesis